MLRTYGRRTFDFARRTAVMAILNRTPDSFYDRGATFGFGAALAAGQRALAEGADWLDVGGVKGGPGPPVSEAEELERVVPLVEALRERTEAVLSVDTYRPGVARRALAAGADVVNDPSGLRDPHMAEVAAEAGAGLVVMHTAGPPRTRPHRSAYADVVAEVRAFLADRAAVAQSRGLPADRLIVDPGHDFHKNTFHSLELTRRLGELADLGHPVLVALSNKDFVGETLDLPIDQRLEGSLAAVAFSVAAGASIVRVHQVRASVRVVRMVEAILGRRPPAVTRRGLA
ncbi:MAG TPA: dihydropteroate synthase [Actinomycetota bacterium]|jgi:dihydropteroate synthase|nr:dihydropteroate synthase [Actinomycetota bacterium]